MYQTAFLQQRCPLPPLQTKKIVTREIRNTSGAGKNHHQQKYWKGNWIKSNRAMKVRFSHQDQKQHPGKIFRPTGLIIFLTASTLQPLRTNLDFIKRINGLYSRQSHDLPEDQILHLQDRYSYPLDFLISGPEAASWQNFPAHWVDHLCQHQQRSLSEPI